MNLCTAAAPRVQRTQRRASGQPEQQAEAAVAAAETCSPAGPAPQLGRCDTPLPGRRGLGAARGCDPGWKAPRAGQSGTRSAEDLHDPDNHDGVITDLEPDILEGEVKWALESITMKKASGVIEFQLSYFKS